MKLHQTRYSFRITSKGYQTLDITVPTDGQDWSWSYESHHVEPCAKPDVRTPGMMVHTKHVETMETADYGRTVVRYSGRAWGPLLSVDGLVELFEQI